MAKQQFPDVGNEILQVDYENISFVLKFFKSIEDMKKIMYHSV